MTHLLQPLFVKSLPQGTQNVILKLHVGIPGLTDVNIFQRSRTPCRVNRTSTNRVIQVFYPLISKLRRLHFFQSTTAEDLGCLVRLLIEANVEDAEAR
jgi:hypothetical protein